MRPLLVKKGTTVVGVILMLAVASCGRKEGVMEDYKAAVKKMEEGYFSADTRLAEEALLQYRATMETWRSKGVSLLDYDLTFAICDSRLMALYSFMGETQKAMQRFQMVTNSLARSDSKKGRSAKMHSPEDILAIIEKGDSNLPLRWKNPAETNR